MGAYKCRNSDKFYLSLLPSKKVNVWYICNCTYHIMSIFLIGENFGSDQTPVRTTFYIFSFTHLLTERFYTDQLLSVHVSNHVSPPGPTCFLCFCDVTYSLALWCCKVQWISIMKGRRVTGSHLIFRKTVNILTICGRDCEPHKYIH